MTIKNVEIREVFPQYEHRMDAKTLARFTADDLRLETWGDTLMVFINGAKSETCLKCKGLLSEHRYVAVDEKDTCYL